MLKKIKAVKYYFIELIHEVPSKNNKQFEGQFKQ